MYSFIVTGNDDVVTMRFKTSSCQGVDILCGTSSPPYTGQIDVPGIYAGESVPELYINVHRFTYWCRIKNILKGCIGIYVHLNNIYMNHTQRKKHM